MEKSEILKIDRKPSFWFSVRFVLVVYLFFGWCFNYMQKIGMSIAIVCMINQTELNLQLQAESNSHMNQSFFSNYQAVNQTTTPVPKSQCHGSQSTHHDGPFVWSKTIQGPILSAYFYGYIFTQLAGGWLSFRFGSVKILSFSMGVGALITASVPIFARINYKALIACLVMSGLVNGAFLASVSGIWAFWAPQSERSRMVGMAHMGSKVGNIIGLMVGSVLCLHGIDGGWPSIFYLFGGLGICWSILFFFLNTDTPSTHKFIGKQEKQFILDETEKAIKTREYCQKHIPWIKILTSKACISIFFSHFAFGWGNFLFLTSTPSYLKDVHKFDIKENGLVSSIPYIASTVMILIASNLADFIIKKKLLSILNVRRLFTLIGAIIPGICSIILSFIDCAHTVWAVVVLTLAISFDAFMIGSGFIVNINDVSGPYSGIVYGISNTIASLSGILAPNIASVITKNSTQSEWQIVFIICAVIYFIGATVSVALLQTNLQPWAIIDINQNEDKIKSDRSQSDLKKPKTKHLAKF